jgi:hypothetical protein
VSAHPSSEPTPLIVLTIHLLVDLVLHQPLTGLFVDDAEKEGHYPDPAEEKNGNALRTNVRVNARRVS